MLRLKVVSCVETILEIMVQQFNIQRDKSHEGAGLLLLQDCALSGAASLLSILLVRWLSDPIEGFTTLVVTWVGAAVAATAFSTWLTGSHKVVRRWATFSSSWRLIRSILIKEAILSIIVIAGLVGVPSYTTLKILLILTDTMLTGLLLMYIRFAARMFSKSEVSRIKRDASLGNALVSGTDKSSVELASQINREGNYHVIGYITSDKDMEGKIIGNSLVYYCTDEKDLEALEWRLGGIDGIFFPKEVGGIGNRDTATNTGTSQVSMSSGMSKAGSIVKRSFDIAVSSVLMIVFSPLALLSAIAVKLEDGGPVLYKQERIGRGGKPFHILKFRSMRTDAEAAGAQLYSGENDPRLTRVGAFLRAHHLDELPQLWNVFKGDMSFIGYRPERQVFIDRIMERNPRYCYLYQIRPGVTSYATLYNGYTDTLEKMLTRLDLDLYYLRHHSVMFDARVLALTFLSIVSGKKF